MMYRVRFYRPCLNLAEPNEPAVLVLLDQMDWRVLNEKDEILAEGSCPCTMPMPSEQQIVELIQR